MLQSDTYFLTPSPTMAIYVSAKECIVLLGGQKGLGVWLEDVEIYGGPAQSPQIPKLDHCSSDWSGVVANGKIYAFGPSRPSQDKEAGCISVYDPAEGKWESIALKWNGSEWNGWDYSHVKWKNVSWSAYGFFKDHICFLGGRNGSSWDTKLCWCYNIQRKIWRSMAPMHAYRLGARCAVMNEKLFVTGGQFVDGHYTTSVEEYDAATDSWSDVQPMQYERANHASVTYQGSMYVIGGLSASSSVLVECERLDPDTGRWQMIGSLNEGREGCRAVVCDGKLFVLGGQNGIRELMKTVEVYDVEKDKWEMAPELKQARSNFAVVPIDMQQM